MPAIRVFFGCALLLNGFALLAAAQSQQNSSSIATLHVNTRLVFLDTTVIDKQGKIITSGLTRDDFLVTEESQPRRIFSFEPPEQHIKLTDAADSHPPVTIFVLDQLNGSFQDFAFIRYSLRKYLDHQPSELETPCELMLLGHRSLQMALGFTRSKVELLSALDHVAPPSLLPVETTAERYNESMYALQLLALQNQGVPGRKNIVWVGYGAPTAVPGPDGKEFGKIVHFTHTTTNMLLEARISLFLIYPGFSGFLGQDGNVASRRSSAEAESTALSFSLDNGADPFTGLIRFGAFARATGGGLSYNNDLDSQFERAEARGSGYYTLTYQPPQIPLDGRFRNIRVTMRNPDLKAITRTGYFDPDPEDSSHPTRHLLENLTVAVRSSVPLYGLNVRIEDLRWRPDTGTAQFTVMLGEQSLRWNLQNDGQSKTNIFFAVASFKGQARMLTSTSQEVTLTRPTQAGVVKQPVIFHVPPKATNLRFIIETEDGDKLGSAEISRNALENAPQAATPPPVLIRRPSR